VNTAYHTALLTTPYFLLYGRHPTVTFDNAVFEWLSEENESLEQSEWLRGRRSAQDLAIKCALNMAERNAARIDCNHTEVDLTPGDLVYRSSPKENARKAKLAPFEGKFFRVMKVVGTTVFMEDMFGKRTEAQAKHLRKVTTEIPSHHRYQYEMLRQALIIPRYEDKLQMNHEFIPYILNHRKTEEGVLEIAVRWKGYTDDEVRDHYYPSDCFDFDAETLERLCRENDRRRLPEDISSSEPNYPQKTDLSEEIHDDPSSEGSFSEQNDLHTKMELPKEKEEESETSRNDGSLNEFVDERLEEASTTKVNNVPSPITSSDKKSTRSGHKY